MPFFVKQKSPTGEFEKNIKKMLRVMDLLCEYQNRLNDLMHIKKQTGLDQAQQKEANFLTECMNKINGAIKDSKLLDTILEQEQEQQLETLKP